MPKTTMFQAKSIDPVTMRGYQETAARRRTEAMRRCELRWARAWDVARKAGDLLRNRFHAQRVCVFGSMLKEDLFHERSDVDLVAWGLRQDDILKAVAEVTSLDSEISVDLVIFEDVPESLRKTIQSEGQPI